MAIHKSNKKKLESILKKLDKNKKKDTKNEKNYK